MEFQVFCIDTKWVKLTITPTRMTIKYPLNFPDDQKEKIEKMSRYIYDVVKPTQSWRGTFFVNGIKLSANTIDGRKYISFKKEYMNR